MCRHAGESRAVTAAHWRNVLNSLQVLVARVERATWKSAFVEERPFRAASGANNQGL